MVPLTPIETSQIGQISFHCFVVIAYACNISSSLRVRSDEKVLLDRQSQPYMVITSTLTHRLHLVFPKTLRARNCWPCGSRVHVRNLAERTDRSSAA